MYISLSNESWFTKKVGHSMKWVLNYDDTVIRHAELMKKIKTP